jgi:hypothetical protein
MLCTALVAAAALAEVEVEQSVLDEVASGRARVVVELRLTDAFRPEGTLGEVEAQAQRQAILLAQQSILTVLGGTDARLLRRPSTVPFLTLEVGSDALSKLRDMPERVTRILKESSAVAN